MRREEATIFCDDLKPGTSFLGNIWGTSSLIIKKKISKPRAHMDQNYQFLNKICFIIQVLGIKDINKS